MFRTSFGIPGIIENYDLQLNSLSYYLINVGIYMVPSLKYIFFTSSRTILEYHDVYVPAGWCGGMDFFCSKQMLLMGNYQFGREYGRYNAIRNGFLIWVFRNLICRESPQVLLPVDMNRLQIYLLCLPQGAPGNRSAIQFVILG
jgi:hypothetical protein